MYQKVVTFKQLIPGEIMFNKSYGNKSKTGEGDLQPLLRLKVEGDCPQQLPCQIAQGLFYKLVGD